MSETTYWLGRAAITLLVLCLIGLAWTQLADSNAPARVWLRTYEGELQKKLRFLRLNAKGRHITLAQGLAMAMCVVATLGSGNVALLLLLPFCAYFPQFWLGRQVTQRTIRFDEQIDTWLTAISNALKASPSLGEAIASTIALVPAPMSEEVDVLVKEHELGTPLDRALDNMAARIGTKTIAATTLALKVARKSGGNLPEMLDSAAAALRELARLEGVVRTKTAEGRAQAWVIGAVPFPMVAGLNAIDPKFFAPLFSNFAGQFVIFIAGVLWLLAIISAQKILAVDV